MYLQITTKCNMTCAHCGLSCGKNGKHGDYHIIRESIRFASEYGTESISIGGGEPTLHPRFFDILKICMWEFDYVWMATNGSQTEKMHRLSRIIDDCDYESIECTCETEEEYYTCYDSDEIISNPEGKLTVALSTDYFHDPINPTIRKLWEQRSKTPGYGLKDVTRSNDGIVGQGRAKKIGYNGKHCVCPGLLIKPDGKIKLCGCTKSPIVGDVLSGIYQKWEKIIDSDDYRESECIKSVRKII
jgi:hypothetical protein